LLDTPVATAINATVCIIGTLSLASSIVFVVLTFSDDSPLGSAEFGPSFGLTFLLWGWMFALFFHHGLLLRPRLCGRRRHPLRRAPNWGAIKTLVPKASYLIVPVLVALAGTAAASAADGGLSGQPEFDAATVAMSWTITDRFCPTRTLDTSTLWPSRIGSSSRSPSSSPAWL
jgi:hypothetical protein